MMTTIKTILKKALILALMLTAMAALMVGLLCLVSRDIILTITGVWLMASGIALLSFYQKLCDELIDMEVKTGKEL